MALCLAWTASHPATAVATGWVRIEFVLPALVVSDASTMSLRALQSSVSIPSDVVG
jgi:hypothetical protein